MEARPGSRVPLLVVAAIMVFILLLGAYAVKRIAIEPHPLHLILIVLDTVRADRLQPYGYAKPTMPALARFAGEAVVFEEARSAAPWTLPSHASMFTGLLPSEHGCDWGHRFLVERHQTLAEELQLLGCETVGVSTNVNASTLFNLHQGFDLFVETWKLRGRRPGLDDSSIAHREIARWLDQRDALRPFFLFVNLSDAHLPYRPAAEFRDSFGPVRESTRQLAQRADVLDQVVRGEVAFDAELAAEWGALYDADLRTLDARLEQLLDLFETRRLLENALVVITSDHGELLGESGLVDHQLSLREELLRVPLLVQMRGCVRPHRIQTPVSLCNLYGWFLDAVHGRTPEWEPAPDRAEAPLLSEYAEPFDLLDRLNAGGADVAGYRGASLAVRSGRLDTRAFKLYQRGSRRALYVLDEGEAVDRAAEFAEVVDRLLTQALLQVEPFGELASDLTLSPAAMHAGDDGLELESLGYVSPDPSLPLHAAEHWGNAGRERRRNEPMRAAHHLEWALNIAPHHPGLLFDLAAALDESGSENALVAFEKYLEECRVQKLASGEYFEHAQRRVGQLQQSRE